MHQVQATMEWIKALGGPPEWLAVQSPAGQLSIASFRVRRKDPTATHTNGGMLEAVGVPPLVRARYRTRARRRLFALRGRFHVG